MPPKSKAQQAAAGIAASATKAGKKVPGNGPAAQMQMSMSQKQMRDFASAPQGTSKLPNKVKQSTAPPPPSGKPAMRMKPKPGGRVVSG